MMCEMLLRFTQHDSSEQTGMPKSFRDLTTQPTSTADQRKWQVLIRFRGKFSIFQFQLETITYRSRFHRLAFGVLVKLKAVLLTLD